MVWKIFSVFFRQVPLPFPQLQRDHDRDGFHETPSLDNNVPEAENCIGPCDLVQISPECFWLPRYHFLSQRSCRGYSGGNRDLDVPENPVRSETESLERVPLLSPGRALELFPVPQYALFQKEAREAPCVFLELEFQRFVGTLLPDPEQRHRHILPVDFSRREQLEFLFFSGGKGPLFGKPGKCEKTEISDPSGFFSENGKNMPFVPLIKIVVS